jgi:hypothetical protein
MLKPVARAISFSVCREAILFVHNAVSGKTLAKQSKSVNCNVIYKIIALLM